MGNNNNKFITKTTFDNLVILYGQKDAEFIVDEIKDIKSSITYQHQLSENDIFVIAYANSIKTSLPNLNNVPRFIKTTYPGINGIHYLPFFLWTSDDGFAVSDYYQIDPRYGSWSQLDEVKPNFNLMFDFVANHSSKDNIWFKKFLDQESPYHEFYVEKDPDFDYTNFIRPRTSPLFHQYRNRHILTTFSEDQVDLNFRSSKLFVACIKLLNFYVEKGMRVVRLDAIGFIWKEDGHTGMHHPHAHLIIKTIKAIMNYLHGNLIIISEVNVPHQENMSYLGENGDESDEVYNFALPPLMAFTLLTGDATKFKKWMRFFSKLKSNESMFNFLSSHDGIGMRPVETILNDKEKAILLNKAKASGGLLGMKKYPDGSEGVYEMNITYTDLIFSDNGSANDIKKYLLAHQMLLFLRGTPAFYINSLMMSRNWYDGVKTTNMNRSINRQKFASSSLKTIFANDDVANFKNGLNQAIKIRKSYQAFSPYALQKNIDHLPRSIIGFQRGEHIKVFANISSQNIKIDVGNNKIMTVDSYSLVILDNNQIVFG